MKAIFHNTQIKVVSTDYLVNETTELSYPDVGGSTVKRFNADSQKYPTSPYKTYKVQINFKEKIAGTYIVLMTSSLTPLLTITVDHSGEIYEVTPANGTYFIIQMGAGSSATENFEVKIWEKPA